MAGSYSLLLLQFPRSGSCRFSVLLGRCASADLLALWPSSSSSKPVLSVVVAPNLLGRALHGIQLQRWMDSEVVRSSESGRKNVHALDIFMSWLLPSFQPRAVKASVRFHHHWISPSKNQSNRSFPFVPGRNMEYCHRKRNGQATIRKIRKAAALWRCRKKREREEKTPPSLPRSRN